jgi:hypothetical protein
MARQHRDTDTETQRDNTDTCATHRNTERYRDTETQRHVLVNLTETQRGTWSIVSIETHRDTRSHMYTTTQRESLQTGWLKWHTDTENMDRHMTELRLYRVLVL